MVSFGPFSFDSANGLLRREDSEVPLPPRVLGVLAYLLARPGQVVPRQDLLDAVWKDAFVTDTSLAEAVSSLRQALGDDPQQPVYIQTLHRRGYRFVARIQEAGVLGPEAGGRSMHGLAAHGFRPPEPESTSPSIAWHLAPWSVAAILAAILAAAIWKLEYASPRPEPPAARFVIDLPPGARLDTAQPAIAVARDGSRLAWSACDDRRCGIWTRALDDLDAAFVDGSEGGRAPFFAPDARRVGFFAGGKLRTLSLAGGTPLSIADAGEPLGASWSPERRIVFAGAPTGGLSSVGETGGRVEPLTRPDAAAGETKHQAPFYTPDGKAILFTVISETGAPRAAIVDPDGGARSLVSDAAGARIGVPGLLIFARAGELLGVAWDDRLRAVAGAPAPLAADVTQFALSGTGTLATSTDGRIVVALEWAREAKTRVPPGVGRIIR